MHENASEPAIQTAPSTPKDDNKQNQKLTIANIKLAHVEERLHDALLENSILNGINRYSIHRQSLKEFLPELLRDMLELIEMPFGIFDHISFYSPDNNYRSDMIVNNNLPFTRSLPATLKDRVVDNLMDHISEIVLSEKHYIKLENLAESVDERGEEMVDTFNVDMVVGLPIISHERVAGVIYLFNSHLSQKQAQIVEQFQDALKQLGYMIEHRYQEEVLSRNYKALQNANLELEDAQEQLLQTEKMASLGQLSAGIAHEINNPLGFLKSNVFTFNNYLESLKKYIAASESLKGKASESDSQELQTAIKDLEALSADIDLEFLLSDSVDLIEESKVGIERVIDIVAGLKRFARQSDKHRENCKLDAIINEALKLTQNELKYTVDIETDLHPVEYISANSSELVQVLVNILINAKQAVGEHGNVSISLQPASGGAEIVIKDDGPGIEETHLNQIFNPFFTTKDVGSGTGLGLSISYGIITDHCGQISVESKPGEGATFTIWLPTL